MAESLKSTFSVNHPKRMAYDVAEITRLCIAEIRNVTDSFNVEIRYAGPRKLMGMVDKVLFERVLTNMLSNSLQALRKKGGSILVTLLNRNGAIFLDVADNGEGIEPHHMNRIFDRGFTHGDHKGTGIGLDTCKQIIESHGGKIEVHSVKNGGTVFTAVFPAAAVLVSEDNTADSSDIILETRDSAIIRRDDTLDPIS